MTDGSHRCSGRYAGYLLAGLQGLPSLPHLGTPPSITRDDCSAPKRGIRLAPVAARCPEPQIIPTGWLRSGPLSNAVMSCHTKNNEPEMCGDVPGIPLAALANIEDLWFGLGPGSAQRIIDSQALDA